MATTETRQFATEQARGLLRHLALQIDRATKSCDADNVHQLRVAIRRYTQAIAACKPCFPGKDMRKIRRQLKKIMVSAGEVRNCDVAMKLIAKWRVPDAIQLQSKLESRRKESASLLAGELKRWTDRRMSVKCRSALAGDQDSFGETTARELARHALSRLAKDFLERGNEAALPKAPPHDLHRFRIVAKKFRYTLELFQPLYGSSLNRSVASIKRANTLLGDINDCVTVAAIAGQYREGKRLVGRLKRRLNKKTEEFRQYWSEESGAGERLRSWIDDLARIKKPAASNRLTSASSTRKSAA